MGRRRVVICTLIFIALSHRNIHFLSLSFRLSGSNANEIISNECYFSLCAVLIYMEKSICFFQGHILYFFHCYFFFISLHSDLLLLLCLCCRQCCCCCCISLSSLILHRSWFLYNFIFIFLLKAILTRKTQQRWSRVLYSSSFFFFFFFSREAC